MREAAVVCAVALAAIGSGQLDTYISNLNGATDAWASLLPSSITQHLSLLVPLLALALLVYSCLPRKPQIYVVDFAVHNADPSWRFPRNAIRPLAEKNGKILPEHIDFLEKIAYRTGLGDDTAVVPAIQSGSDAKCNMEAARFEFATTCYSCIQELLEKTGVRAGQINFVITNSSLFNPTPSLSASIMNQFGMGKRTKGYSLGGMGCSAGVIAIDLAREMLELYPNSYALVVSHENITNAFYTGRDPSMLLINCLFRANGCAVLLSNKRRDAGRSKYWIKNIVRTNLARDDTAFNCVIQTEDEQGVVGVRLNKDIVQVGTRALKDNMTALGPLVLPISEQLTFAANMATRQLAKAVKPLKKIMPKSWTKPYIPDFKKAFDFYCIHTGGRGIIDGLEKELKLSRQQVEPSRASLYRFGNTSSTSVWYELAYIETRQGVSRGQRVWQLAFGSGFKFNSSIMIANKRIKDSHRAWAGFDVAAMWVELDKLEASAKAAREAKAKKAAAEAAGIKDTETTAAAADKPTVVRKPSTNGRADDTAADEPSAFATAPDIAERIPDVAPVADQDSAGVRSFRSSRSMRRMPSISRPNSMAAIGSGTVPMEDMPHLEADVDIEVIEEGDEQAR